MRRIFLLFFVCCYYAVLTVRANTLFDKLNYELSQKVNYDEHKEAAIKKLKTALFDVAREDLAGQYTLSLKIYNEYKAYQFDSAYVYATKMQQLSIALHDKQKEDYSHIKMAFILLSSGMFTETFINLHNIKASALPVDARIEYYAILTRAYYDLADYDNDRHFAPQYKQQANNYIDSAIALSLPSSYDRVYFSCYKKSKNGHYEESITGLNNLLNSPRLSIHQYAIVASTLGNIYMITGRKQQGIELLIKATIADIHSSTKETLALFWLAQLIYQQGDIKDAYTYLQAAHVDAEFYGARQRNIEIGAILPHVASENLTYVERENTHFLIYLSLIAALALTLVWLSIVLFKQLKQVRAKETVIDDQNQQLTKINRKLMESTKIKEEYIGYFFNVISGYILQLEKLKRSIDTKLHTKRYDDIQLLIDRINIKKERQDLFYTFDHAFLRIFPNFIYEFNLLFKPEDQIWPKEHEVLTTDLRIFALIRMGITDTQTIAKILEYTDKTIYVYKMRIKAKALIQGEEFDHRIMAIKAVNLNEPNH